MSVRRIALTLALAAFAQASHAALFDDEEARKRIADTNARLAQVQKQLDRYERAGILVSEKIGATRLYRYNLKCFLTQPFMELIKSFYEALPDEDRKKLLEVRRRPRRAGKKVLLKLKPGDAGNSALSQESVLYGYKSDDH